MGYADILAWQRMEDAILCFMETLFLPTVTQVDGGACVGLWYARTDDFAISGKLTCYINP